MPPLTLEVFRTEFDSLVKEQGINWETVGFFAPDGKVYAFGTDTKVLSTVFEALAAPLIAEVAARAGYAVEGSPQTVYPDFTLIPLSEDHPKIALDIKTTYRRFNNNGEPAPFRYTLGSYTSFLRDPNASKNIKYPYKEYSDHWTLGFLYTRREGVTSKVYVRPEEVTSMLCPYEAVEYFIQHKHNIVGTTPASGNTANIGSFPVTSIQPLRDGLGPFASLGKIICDEYWRSYPRSALDRISSHANLKTFLEWRERSG